MLNFLQKSLRLRHSPIRNTVVAACKTAALASLTTIPHDNTGNSISEAPLI